MPSRRKACGRDQRVAGIDLGLNKGLGCRLAQLADPLRTEVVLVEVIDNVIVARFAVCPNVAKCAFSRVTTGI